MIYYLKLLAYAVGISLVLSLLLSIVITLPFALWQFFFGSDANIRLPDWLDEHLFHICLIVAAILAVLLFVLFVIQGDPFAETAPLPSN